MGTFVIHTSIYRHQDLRFGLTGIAWGLAMALSLHCVLQNQLCKRSVYSSSLWLTITIYTYIKLPRILTGEGDWQGRTQAFLIFWPNTTESLLLFLTFTMSVKFSNINQYLSYSTKKEECSLLESIWNPRRFLCLQYFFSGL